jgi:hypothetical protein
MIKTYLKYSFIAAGAVCLLNACERNIDIKINPGKEQLVVEGYINNLLPQMNYVVLTKTQDYYNPNFQSAPVTGATVSITEGALSGGNLVWNNASKVFLTEINNPAVPAGFNRGAYFDSRVHNNPSQALKGEIGKYYLLEIEAEGKKYSSSTALLTPVMLDSVNSGFPFVDEEGKDKLRITNNYKDPDTLGNRQFYFWRFRENRRNFGWSGMAKSRAPGRDDLANGEYIRITHPQGFDKGDTLTYYLASVSAEVWNFWDSFNKARDNNGPFATPVNLGSTIVGTDVIGCFSGMALSEKTIILK